VDAPSLQFSLGGFLFAHFDNRSLEGNASRRGMFHGPIKAGHLRTSDGANHRATSPGSGSRHYRRIRRRPRLSDVHIWHLDEVYLKIDGGMVYLWRAAEGVLDVLVQTMLIRMLDSLTLPLDYYGAARYVYKHFQREIYRFRIICNYVIFNIHLSSFSI
jgi:hypothetical protein